MKVAGLICIFENVFVCDFFVCVCLCYDLIFLLHDSLIQIIQRHFVIMNYRCSIAQSDVVSNVFFAIIYFVLLVLI
jgi:hypothetical protein